MDIEQIIKIEQAKHKTTATATAAAMGISSQAYTNMLKKGNPTINTLERVANAMGCDLIITFKDREDNN